MAIPLATQQTYATTQPVYRQSVQSALVSIAITSFTATPLADQAKQDKRLALASQVLHDPDMWLDTVAWVVITRPSLTSTDDINDAAITGILTQSLFDTLADKLIVLPV